MIRLLQREEIDTGLWEDCINQSQDGQIFARSWYLDICCPGWMALVKGNYEAVFPIASRSKFGVSYLYQPFFTRHFGVYAKHETGPGERVSFLDAIPDKFKYWDICLHASHMESPATGYSEVKTFQYLNLKSDYSLLKENYHDNHLRNLRKAEKEGLSILPDYNPDIIVEHFRIHQKEKNLGLEDGDFNTLKSLMKVSGAMADTKCWAAVSSKGEVLAGAFFMGSNSRIVYLKGFTTQAGKKNGAMHFIFDRLIRANAGTEVVLDFGGSNVESVARFFKGFGAVDSLYLHLKINRLPTFLRWLRS